MRPLLIRYPKGPWIWSMLYLRAQIEGESALERHGIINVYRWGPFMLVTLPRKWRLDEQSKSS